MAYSSQPLKFGAPVSLIIYFVTIASYCLDVNALDLGLHSGPRQCSRVCESRSCQVGPFLRYGKFCGLLYTGCPGEVPCDGLDACCMHHDKCINERHSYLSQHCNREFMHCVENFRRSGAPLFPGSKCDINDVANALNNVMNIAVMAGSIFNQP